VTTAAIPRPRRSSGIRFAESLARVEDEPSRQRLLARWPRLVRPDFAHRLLEASRELLRVDSRTSLVLAQAAGTIAAGLSDCHILGLSRRAAANALCLSGSVRESLALHQQAIAAFEAAGDGPELARTLNASIQPLILLGEYDRALETAGRAHELFASQGDELRLARLDINIGNLLHRQDRSDEALGHYEQAHARLAALGDTDGVISALHNKAVSLTALNEFHQALAAYQAVRQLCVARNMAQATAQVDYNIAWLHYQRGEYSRALELLQAAAAFARQSGDGYHEALSLLDIGEIYLELNLGAEAHAAADDARARFLRLGMGYEAAKALAIVAIAAGQDGATGSALGLFADARAQFVGAGNRVWPSVIDLYQAILLFNDGRLAEAERLCVAALEVFATTRLRVKTALCRILLARINLRLGRPAEARRECETVLESVTSLDTPILSYHARLVLGHVDSEAGNASGAYASYQAARAALEELRSRLRGEELKIAFVGNKLEVYERLIELCLDRQADAGDFDEILACIEQAKSRALLDLISEPVHGLARPDPAETPIERSLLDIRRELTWYHHRIELEQVSPDGHPEHVDRLRNELCAREREFARVLREAALSDPRHGDLQQPSVQSVDAIRAALPADAVLLEYFEVRGRILVCVLDRESLSVVGVTETSRVTDRVRMLQFQLSKFRLDPGYIEAFQAPLLRDTTHHLRALFQELLAPVWPAVRGRHLLVVPHGVLHYVPFHALYDGERHVVDTSTVSYAPSASVYARCHSLPPVQAQGALVMGVPDAKTPFIEMEAKAVAAALPGARLFLGADATEQILRAHGGDSRFVHIASHAYFRPGSPMFSALQLSDTHLNVHDLYHLRMPAELVTLSGCATGAGLTTGGDELLGIARGLFCAGARALLVSLWDVHDQSTATSMASLYGRIVAGTAPAQALREVMIELRAEHPHPFYWAPFVLMGKFWAGD
jgi:CHAT domain-containing protein/tetratricopeptide (TPR) repeat protein